MRHASVDQLEHALLALADVKHDADGLVLHGHDLEMVAVELQGRYSDRVELVCLFALTCLEDGMSPEIIIGGQQVLD